MTEVPLDFVMLLLKLVIGCDWKYIKSEPKKFGCYACKLNFEAVSKRQPLFFNKSILPFLSQYNLSTSKAINYILEHQYAWTGHFI
jgi:hypothetical protein